MKKTVLITFLFSILFLTSCTQQYLILDRVTPDELNRYVEEKELDCEWSAEFNGKPCLIDKTAEYRLTRDEPFGGTYWVYKLTTDGTINTVYECACKPGKVKIDGTHLQQVNIGGAK